MWIDDSFPRLASEGYQITSEPNGEYNCIAYAAGETDRWWAHLDGYYWPESANRSALVQSLIQVFNNRGRSNSRICGAIVMLRGYNETALFAIIEGVIIRTDGRFEGSRV